jgi:hypothetical protein
MPLNKKFGTYFSNFLLTTLEPVFRIFPKIELGKLRKTRSEIFIRG